MTRGNVLISHVLRPYVQRVAIVMHEKNLAFERRDIDLLRKPDWFLELSPTGKTPILPKTPLSRARHRAWMEFASSTLGSIASLYLAQDETALERSVHGVRSLLGQIEQVLGAGPYFGGEDVFDGRCRIRTGVTIFRGDRA